MGGLRGLMLFAAATSLMAVVLQVMAQDTPPSQPPSPQHTSLKLILEDSIGLHKNGLTLPFDLNYDHETKNLLFTLGTSKKWGVGINLDIGNAQKFNSESGLGVDDKSAPGMVIQHNF